MSFDQNKSLLFTQLAKYYDSIYSFKDYAQDVDQILNIINDYKRSNGNDLLDVACGTGKHLSLFLEHFNCTGTDLSPEMLHVARQNLPMVEFLQSDMRDFKFEKKFDVITCLFRSIGYIKTEADLMKVWSNYEQSLKPGGVAIVESWFSKESAKFDQSYLSNYEGKDITISRLHTMTRKDSIATLDFHFLIAEGLNVSYFHDVHELFCIEPEQMLNFIQQAGLQAHFIALPAPKEPGIFVGVKV